MQVPVEAMSYGAPPPEPSRFYSSLPQMSTWPAQEVTSHDVPVSVPICPMTPALALHSQNRGSIMVPIFQQRLQTKQQHALSSTAWHPSEDGDIIFMGITHEDDDIKEISLSDKSPMVPEKCQWVGQNVTQNITQSIAQSASVVGKAAVLDVAELELIESCLGKSVTPTDTEAEDSPMKATTERKKKCSQKEQDQSCDRWWEMSSESNSAAHHPTPQQNPTTPTKAEPEGGSQIRESIWKQAIVMSEHQKCRATDYFFIHNMRNQLGLLSKEVNQDDMSGFLNDINEKKQETWNKADWCKSYIWSIKGALAVLWQTIKKPDKDVLPVLLANLQNAITQLEECQYHRTMPVAGDLKGMVDPPFQKYIARVFVDNKGNPLNTLTRDTSSRVMLGLLQLHTKDAICCHL